MDSQWDHGAAGTIPCVNTVKQIQGRCTHFVYGLAVATNPVVPVLSAVVVVVVCVLSHRQTPQWLKLADKLHQTPLCKDHVCVWGCVSMYV
eukprot:m.1490536 g.1490536  ORF g.1490536 m.1490536 type:complete len:91 (+) comp25191_c0_seq10:576-848(+)